MGILWFAVGACGLLRLDSWVDEFTFCTDIERFHGEAPYPAPLRPITRQLEQYFQGRRRVFDIELDLGSATPFQRLVLEAVAQVPYGEAHSYRDIAWAVNNPGAARAVGGAVAACPIGVVIPCHRIIRSDGSLGEYARGTLGPRGVELKRRLLALEGWQPTV